MVNAVEIVIIIIHGVAFRAGFIILLYGFFYFFRFCLFLRFGSGLLRVGFRRTVHIAVRRAALGFTHNFFSTAPTFSQGFGLRFVFRGAEHITICRTTLIFTRDFLSTALAFSTLLFLFLQLDLALNFST